MNVNAARKIELAFLFPLLLLGETEAEAAAGNRWSHLSGQFEVGALKTLIYESENRNSCYCFSGWLDAAISALSKLALPWPKWPTIKKPFAAFSCTTSQAAKNQKQLGGFPTIAGKRDRSGWSAFYWAVWWLGGCCVVIWWLLEQRPLTQNFAGCPTARNKAKKEYMKSLQRNAWKQTSIEIEFNSKQFQETSSQWCVCVYTLGKLLTFNKPNRQNYMLYKKKPLMKI